mmetsp:Transcript_100547/g.313395  ORF Transcript_100547/g.313395 Transcript_100547/m.313395 type:complete len:276 (-) Transcript_100547:6-833(-)
MREFASQNLSNTAWSFATLLEWHGPLMAAISAASIRPISQGQASPQDLANTAWSLSRLNWRDRPLLASLSAASLAPIPALEPQDLANTAWSLSRLGVAHAPLLNAIAAAAIRKITALSTQNLVNMAWAYAALPVRPRRGGDLLAEAFRSLAASGREDVHSLDWAAWKASQLPGRAPSAEARPSGGRWSAGRSPGSGAACPSMCSAIWMDFLWSRNAEGEAWLFEDLARASWDGPLGPPAVDLADLISAGLAPEARPGLREPRGAVLPETGVRGRT